MSEKNKYIFIYSDGVDAFVPLEDMDQVMQQIEGLLFSSDGTEMDVHFKVKHMTEEDFENLPEAE